MAEETIKISVVASGFDQVQRGLSNTSKALDDTSKSAANASRALGSQLNNASGQASNTLTNLNRVVQDAPFGFMGIANNINPLIESFGRLRAESGSTGGAFKSLLSSLAGPAGIGIAVAAITTALTFAQIGFQRWGASAKKAKDEADAFKKAQEDFSKSLDSAKSSALASGLALQSYVDVAKNSKLPIEQRNEALKRANEILGEHGKQLTLASIATAEGTNEITLYTKALVAQAVAGKYVDQISALQIQKTNLENKKIQLNTDLTNANTQAQSLSYLGKRKLKTSYGGASVAADDYNNAIKKQSDLSSQLKKVESDLATTTSEIDKLQKDLTKSTNEATSAFGELGTKSKDTSKKTKKDVETIDSVIAKLREDLKDQIAIGVTFNKSTLDEQINLTDTAIKKLVSDFNIDPNDKRKLSLIVELNNLTAKKFNEDISSIFLVAQSEINKIYLEPNYDETGIKKQISLAQEAIDKLKELETQYGKQIDPKLFKDLNDQLAQFKQKLAETKEIPLVDIKLPVSEFDKQLQQVGNIIEGMANDVGILFAEVLGSAFSGGGFDFLSGFYSIISTGLIAIGKELLKIGGIAEIVKTALENIFTNPAMAIVAGFAAIALGTAIKGLINKKAFAVGTNYAPGGMALVGERGPEMVSLPRGARVTPAAQTAQMMGGAMQQVEVFGVLRGQDIYFSNKKYSQTYRRTT